MNIVLLHLLLAAPAASLLARSPSAVRGWVGGPPCKRVIFLSFESFHISGPICGIPGHPRDVHTTIIDYRSEMREGLPQKIRNLKF